LGRHCDPYPFGQSLIFLDIDPPGLEKVMLKSPMSSYSALSGGCSAQGGITLNFCEIEVVHRHPEAHPNGREHRDDDLRPAGTL
jgi:hypothetical protein